jgi:hypothetical protein
MKGNEADVFSRGHRGCRPPFSFILSLLNRRTLERGRLTSAGQIMQDIGKWF